MRPATLWEQSVPGGKWPRHGFPAPVMLTTRCATEPPRTPGIPLWPAASPKIQQCRLSEPRNDSQKSESLFHCAWLPPYAACALCLARTGDPPGVASSPQRSQASPRALLFAPLGGPRPPSPPRLGLARRALPTHPGAMMDRDPTEMVQPACARARRVNGHARRRAGRLRCPEDSLPWNAVRAR